MKIKSKLRISTIFSLCAALAAGFALFLISQEVDKAIEKNKIADEVVKGVFELDTLTYEYLLNHEERMQAQWQLRHESLSEILTKMKFKGPEAGAVWDRINQEHAGIKILFDRLVATHEGHKSNRKEISRELQDRLIGQMQVKSQAMVSVVFQLAEASHTEIDGARQRAGLLLIFFIAAIAAVVSATSFVISRSVVKPVTRLHEGTEIIGSGNLEFRVGTDAQDEIGQLSRAFDLMTEALKRQTASVEASERRTRALMENVPVGISASSPEGGVPEVNSTLWKIFGYGSKEEFIKVPASAHYYDPKDRERFIELHGKGEVRGFEARFKRKDGSVFWGAVTSITQTSEAGTMQFFNIFEDITERRRTEEELRLHSTIILNMAEGVYLIRVSDGAIVYTNPKFEEMFGYGHGEMIGKHVSLVNATTDKSPEATAREIMEALNEQKGVWRGEVLNIKKNGTPFWCHAEVTTFDHPDYGTVWISVHQEITDRKHAEEEVKRLNAELERKVLERTAQLEAANKELEAFSYSVSHDLRAPLRHLTGFVELLNKKMPEALDDKSRHYLEVISTSARHMGKLVDDLLSFSRMGRAEMMKSRISLDNLLKEAMNELRGDMDGRDILWKVGPLPEVYGDSAMLRLVLVNLLSNAIKFTRPRKPAELEIGHTSSDDREYIFYVKDNGVGFDHKYVDKLFGLFQRLHRADEFEGTGLGLANVRRIIHRHGGKTWAEGSVDGGAAFYFSLPKESSIANENPSPYLSPRGRG